MTDFDRREQGPAPDARRCGAEHAGPTVLAGARVQHRAVQLIDVVDIRGTRRRKITFIGKVGPFLELDAAHQLRDEKAQVRIAMRVCAGRRVHGHTGDHHRKVGAVIQIEAAQVVLIRLALAAVLADDHSGHRLQHFTRTHDRPSIELRRGHRALAGCRCDPDEIL